MQMTNEIANKIIERLNGYADSDAFAAFAKDNPVVSAQIKSLTAGDLSFGECPTFGIAQIEGDLTADGVSYTDARGKKTDIISSHLDDGYIQRYKIAGPFTSDPLLIAPPENAADSATLKIVARRLDFGRYYYENEVSGIAQSTAKETAKNELARMDYKMQNFRVNTYRLNYTYGPLPVYVYPVYADLKDKKGKVHRTIIATYSEISVDNGEPLDTPEIYADVQALIKEQKLGGRTSKSAKKKKILAWVFGTLGVLLVLGLLGSCVAKCLL